MCACVHAKPLQSCLNFCDLMDYNPPGSSVHGILQQEHQSESPCPPPGDLLTQGSNPHLLHLLHWQVGSLPLAPPGEVPMFRYNILYIAHLGLKVSTNIFLDKGTAVYEFIRNLLSHNCMHFRTR